MKNVITKIGEVEVTPGVAQFLENMLTSDVDTYMVSIRLQELSQVQDFLTRILLNLEDPDPEITKSCLSTVMSVRDQLSLLVDGKEKGGEQC